MPDESIHFWHESISPVYWTIYRPIAMIWLRYKDTKEWNPKLKRPWHSGVYRRKWIMTIAGKFLKIWNWYHPGRWEFTEISIGNTYRKSPEQRWISHEMSTRMSRFRAVLKYLQRVCPGWFPQGLYRPYRGKHIGTCCIQPISLYRSRLTRTRIWFLTPGTQGLYFAAGAAIFCRATAGTWSVDYFANRKMVNSSMVYCLVLMHYENRTDRAGIDLEILKRYLLTE